MSTAASGPVSHLKTVRANQSVRPAPWREEALARAARLRSELTGIQVRNELDERWSAEAVAREILNPLDEAIRLASVDRMTPREWWTGSQIEECWRRLRQAEEGILQVVKDDVVTVPARAAEGHGTALLKAGDSRLVELRKHLGDGRADKKELRGLALQVLRGAHEVSDDQHREMRSFRNQLLCVSVILIVFAGVLLAVNPELELSVASGLPATGGVAAVMFFGMIGALFSAVPSLSTAPEVDTPFIMSRQQALLKVVTGAWSAVIGLLVVNAGLATGTADTSSTAGVLIVAALFGAGQEAVTRFADHKANNILEGSRQ